MDNANANPSIHIDHSQFPLTTQEGLSPKDQAMIDCVNLDELREAVANGERLTDDEKAIMAELETKDQMRKAAHTAYAESEAGAKRMSSWDESRHPRGQPDNPGQFVSKTSGVPSRVTLWRAANDEFANADSTSFSRSKDAAKQYLDNPGFGGPTLYKTKVDIDPKKVFDLYSSADPVSDICEELGIPHPGAIGADEWIPRIAQKLQDHGVQWVRVKESYPEESETWIHIGGNTEDPELEEQEE